MKVSSLLPTTFSLVNSAAIQTLQESAELPFSEQVAQLGLDKANDLVNADLVGVDFSYSDLRGYDLSGADLRGSVGICVQWDASTALDRATLAGSIFASAYRTSQALHQDPTAARTFNRLRKAGENEKILWTADSLSSPRTGLSPDAAMTVAQALFANAESSFLRSQLLFFMAPRLGPNVLKELLTEVLANNSGSGALIQSALGQIWQRGLVHDPHMRRMIMALTRSVNPLVKAKATVVLIRSNLSEAEQTDLIRRATVDDVVANAYVSERALQLGGAFALVVRHPVTNAPFRMVDVVARKTVELIAKRWIRAEESRAEEKEGVPLHERKGAFDDFVPERTIKQRAEAVLQLWKELENVGILLTRTET